MFDEDDEFQTVSIEIKAMATAGIVQTIDAAQYRHRIGVRYFVSYPNQQDFRQSVSFDEKVVLNGGAEDDQAADHFMGLFYWNLINGEHAPRQHTLHDIHEGQGYLFATAIDDHRGNQDSKIIICFWVPDGDAEEVCMAVAGTYQEIWDSFVAAPEVH